MIIATCNICKYAGRPIYKSPCSECKDFSKYEYENKKTNADRIRSMTDEELAENMSDWPGLAAWNKKFRRLSDELEAIKEGANVVPVSELLEVRDALYYADQITLRWIGQLNVLIDKHAVRVEDGPVEEMRHE